MDKFILRKEICGYILYDIDRDSVFWADSNIIDLYDEKNYKALSRNNIILPTDFFINNCGRVVDNTQFKNIFAAPETVFLEVTKKCNLRCGHCFNESGIPYDNELSLEEIIKLINSFEEMGVFTVKVTGGEPFCRDDLIDILHYLDVKSINYIVFSNGTNISNENIQKLKTLKHLLKIRISIDGTKNTNDSIRGLDSFEKAMETIKILCANDIPCEVNYTITKSNYLQISDLAEYLNKNNITCKINIGMVKIAGRAKNESEEYYFTEDNIVEAVEQIKKQLHDSKYIKPFYLLEPIYYEIFGQSFGCPAGKLTTTIKCNGDVYPCGLLSDYKYFLCGNIRNEKFQNIWNNTKMDKIRNLPKQSVCTDCNYYLKTCTGACRGNAMNYFHDICGKDINCFVYQVDFNN